LAWIDTALQSDITDKQTIIQLAQKLTSDLDIDISTYPNIAKELQPTTADIPTEQSNNNTRVENYSASWLTPEIKKFDTIQELCQNSAKTLIEAVDKLKKNNPEMGEKLESIMKNSINKLNTVQNKNDLQEALKLQWQAFIDISKNTGLIAAMVKLEQESWSNISTEEFTTMFQSIWLLLLGSHNIIAQKDNTGSFDPNRLEYTQKSTITRSDKSKEFIKNTKYTAAKIDIASLKDIDKNNWKDKLNEIEKNNDNLKKDPNREAFTKDIQKQINEWKDPAEVFAQVTIDLGQAWLDNAKKIFDKMLQNNEKFIGQQSLEQILNAPNQTRDQLLKNGKLIFEENSAAYNKLFETGAIDTLTWPQQENLKNIILTYALWGVNIFATDDKGKKLYTIPEKIDQTWFKTEDAKYMSWTQIIQIPQKNIIGIAGWEKVYEIYFWTIDQLHAARTKKTTDENNKILHEKTLQPNWEPKAIQGIISWLDEAWSYKAFRAFLDNLDNADPKYLANNFGTLLPEIQKSHIDNGKEQLEWARSKIDGYYRVIAEKVVDLAEKWDKNTLQTYLQYIKATPSYLWNDSPTRIQTWNIVAERGDKNILKSTNPADTELHNLYTETKTQLENRTKKDILTQLDDNFELFMERYGAAIALIVDFFWWKGTFMKMLPSAMRHKFIEKFKESNKMSEWQIKNFNIIQTSFKEISGTPIGKPAEDIIKDTKEHPETLSTIKVWLEKNFTVISPSLIIKTIKDYNKKQPSDETKLKPEDFVMFDEKWVAISTKNAAWKEKIIEELLGSDTMRKNIIEANKHVVANAKFDLRTDNEVEKWKGKDKENQDINGSKEPKGIGSYADVAIYIAAYAATGGTPPYHHVISENDTIKTSTAHTEKKIESTETPKTKEQLHIEELKNINDMITEGKYKNTETESVDFPTDYNWTDYPQYEENIIKPLSSLFSNNKPDDSQPDTLFTYTTKNITELSALQSNPQVLKDLITYTANKPENKEQKTTIEKIATDITAIKEIKKQDDWNILVQIDDNKKMIIKPGPTFELPV
jgi:hypothetical protein